MALIQPSSAPLFENVPSWDGSPDRMSAFNSNQWLGDQANHHDGEPVLGPNANRVQPGALSTITSTPPGPVTKAKPAGGR